MKYKAIPLSIAALLCAPPLLAQQDMSNMPGTKGMQQSAEAQGVGVVKALDIQQGTITLQHQAIASIHWPAMTMAFKVAKPEVLQGVKVGEQVRFGLRTQGMSGTVTWIKPAGQ